MQRSTIIQPVGPTTEGSLTMKGPMATVAVLLVVTFAFWIGPAEAQRRGGMGRAAPARPTKGGLGAGAAKVHPPQPKGNAHQKPNGAKAKGAEKKKKSAPQEKNDAKTDHAHENEKEKKERREKEERKERREKEERKERREKEERKERREKEERKERREKEERKEMMEKKERKEGVGAREKPLGKAILPDRANEPKPKASP